MDIDLAIIKEKIDQINFDVLAEVVDKARLEKKQISDL